MQVGKCLTRSSKQQRLKYLSTDNDSRSSSWELLISVESRVKYRPRSFDSIWHQVHIACPVRRGVNTMKVFSGPGVWPSATHFSKYLVKASYSFFKLRKNLSNVEKVKLFKPVDMFIDWDQGLYEWFWTQGGQKWGACILCSDCRVSGGPGRASCDHYSVSTSWLHWFPIVTLTLARPGHCPNPHVPHINIILRTQAKNIHTQKFCNFTRQKYSI